MNRLSTASCYQKHYQGNEWKRPYYIKMFVLPPSPFSVLLFISDMTAAHLKYMHLNVKSFNHCKHALCSPLKSHLCVAQCGWHCVSVECRLVDKCARTGKGATVVFTGNERNIKNKKKYCTKSTESGLGGDFSQFLTSVSLQPFIC